MRSSRLGRGQQTTHDLHSVFVLMRLNEFVRTANPCGAQLPGHRSAPPSRLIYCPLKAGNSKWPGAGMGMQGTVSLSRVQRPLCAGGRPQNRRLAGVNRRSHEPSLPTISPLFSIRPENRCRSSTPGCNGCSVTTSNSRLGYVPVTGTEKVTTPALSEHATPVTRFSCCCNDISYRSECVGPLANHPPVTRGEGAVRPQADNKNEEARARATTATGNIVSASPSPAFLFTRSSIRFSW